MKKGKALLYTMVGAVTAWIAVSAALIAYCIATDEQRSMSHGLEIGLRIIVCCPTVPCAGLLVILGILWAAKQE